MGIRMITIAAHRYEGVWLKAGDQFEALNERDADELRCTGFARLEQTASAGGYETRVATAEPVTASAAAPRQKRAYHRRDQSAR